MTGDYFLVIRWPDGSLSLFEKRAKPVGLGPWFDGDRAGYCVHWGLDKARAEREYERRVEANRREAEGAMS